MLNEPVKVFYEPKIPAHRPELYAFEGVDAGVSVAEAAEPSALERYQGDGWLMVRGLLSPELVASGRATLEAMALDDEPDCEQIWYEGALREHLALDAAKDQGLTGRAGGTGFIAGQQAPTLPPLERSLRARYVRKFAGFVGRQEALTQICWNPPMLAVIKRLLGGGAPHMFQDMALVKPAGGREKPWHQDHAYFNVALDTPIVGVWIPFGQVTPENGCMHMLKGGHQAGPRLHFKRRDWQICDSEAEGAQRIAVPMQAGDVLFFDGKVPHGTPVNRTDSFRWAVQYHYRPKTAQEVADEVRLEAFGAEGKDVTC